MGQKIHDIFGPGSNVNERVFRDYHLLRTRVLCLRGLGLKIVLTSGTFDLFHVGHSRYLEAARALGDFLIVGVDSDEKVKKRKGPNRPIVPEDERLEIICHTRYPDAVFLKGANDEHWQLIKIIEPDILVISKSDREHDSGEIAELKKFAKEVIVLEPQAITSTTAKIRKLLITPVDEVRRRLRAAFDSIEEVLDGFTKGGDA
ncbi:MAG TPA: adenylyltransferase/cytidyltransferase family protein [Candidatus Paceibacterota bacterium]